MATSLNNLAALYRDQGQYAAGRAALQALAGDPGEGLGPDHPDVATSLNNLAGLYQDQGQYAQAEPLYKRALAIVEKALGPDHPDVATSLNNLAGCTTPKASTRRPSRSTSARWRSRRRPSAQIIPMWPQPEQPRGAVPAQGQYAQAEPLYKRALAIKEKALGPDHPDVATSLNNLAELYQAQGQYARGRAALQARAGDQGEGPRPGPSRCGRRA